MQTKITTPENSSEIAPPKAEEQPPQRVLPFSKQITAKENLVAQSGATIDDFHKIEMKIGTILVAEYVEGADKLLRLEVDFGPAEIPAIEFTGSLNSEEDAPASPKEKEPEDRDVRQILSGIREYYEPAELIGKQCPFITNLEPRKIRGLMSNGMILAVGSVNGGAVILHPEKDVPPGSKLR